MYNRYIPQSDGTYRRSRVETPEMPSGAHDQPQQSVCETPESQSAAPSAAAFGSQSASSFLKQLLPKNMDTGDLLVIALLLLMAGDKPGQKSTAWLTLALYLFM